MDLLVSKMLDLLYLKLDLLFFKKGLKTFKSLKQFFSTPNALHSQVSQIRPSTLEENSYNTQIL